MMMRAPDLPNRSWGEAERASTYILNKTPSLLLDGKAPLDLWNNGPPANVKLVHEWVFYAYKHIKARHRS